MTEPRCNCGHLFELCPQADCTAIDPLDLTEFYKSIEADQISAEIAIIISEEQT